MKRNTQLAKLIIAKRNAPNAIAALATANKKQNVKKNGRGLKTTPILFYTKISFIIREFQDHEQTPLAMAHALNIL